MKYIDSEKLITEIEKLLAKAKNDEEKAFAKKDAAGHLAAVTMTAVCVKIKKLITSLQQERPEMDLEKERKNLNPTMLTYAAEVFGGKTLLEDISYSYRRELADYFNGLVKAARKEK